MSEQNRKWYVVRAISGKERKVQQYLESEISRLNLGDIISKVLIPIEKVYQVRNGKKISKERNNFVYRRFYEQALNSAEKELNRVQQSTENWIIPSRFNAYNKRIEIRNIPKWQRR